MRLFEFSDLEIQEDFDLSLVPSVLAPVREYFKALGFEYREPIVTRVKNIADKSTNTNFPGVYFMYGIDVDTGQAIDFYIGVSVDKISSRWATHVPKLQQNAHSLFHMSANPNKISTGPRSTWENPARYRAGVAKQFYAGKDMEEYRKFAGKKGKANLYTPGNLTYKGQPIEGRNVLDLPVLIWDLTGWPAGYINLLEKAMIRYYKPEFNNEDDISKPAISLDQLEILADEIRKNPKLAKVKTPKVKIAKTTTKQPKVTPLGIEQQINDPTTVIGKFYAGLNGFKQSTFRENLKQAAKLNKSQEWVEQRLQPMTQSTFSPSYS